MHLPAITKRALSLITACRKGNKPKDQVCRAMAAESSKLFAVTINSGEVFRNQTPMRHDRHPAN